MAAQANITINDGLATPVAHTFLPRGVKADGAGQKATWKDTSVAQAVGQWTLHENFTPYNKNGMGKFHWVIDVPTLEQAGSGGSFVPPPTRAFGTIVEVIVRHHERASATERAHAAALAKNFAASAYFKAAVEGVDPAF